MFAEIKPSVIKELPIPKSNQKTQDILALIVQFLIETQKSNEDDYLENLINGIVYELYFGEEMKKAGVDILALVEKDLEAVKKLSPEKAIAKLYEKWQEPKNEVRNRLLLMATRCPDTIGVIEASVS